MLPFKLQIFCFILSAYVAFDFAINRRKKNMAGHTKVFIALITTYFIYLAFDCATVYTVNHTDSVNRTLNLIIHLIFFLSIEALLFLLFRYIMQITDFMPQKSKALRLLLYVPLAVASVIVCAFIGELEFKVGTETNYSWGVSAIACYVMGAVYLIGGLAVFIIRHKFLHKNKSRALAFCFGAVIAVMCLQMIYPEALITSAAPALAILGFYINVESNDKTELEEFQKEMLHSFADLVESRDGNTGEHIKRTTEYVRIIAEELRKNSKYSKQMTVDYIDMLMQSAPMHDVGKIAIPDSILQKPGKLTDEEFAIIKNHTVEGEKIIRQSFKNIGDKECAETARLTALYHHEKWNGRGYPEGISGEDIPLCARIMAVADVFDAVSQDRCYRKAMTMEQSFAIIEKGSGSDFDPEIAGAFLSARSRVEKAHTAFFNGDAKTV